MIQWDVVEEHLAQAGVLFALWEQALRASTRSLSSIAKAPEARLLAHLDGLLLASPAAAAQVLAPALESDKPGEVFAAAFALLGGGQPEGLDAVLAALAQTDPSQRAAIRRALALTPLVGIGARLVAAVAKSSPSQVDLLEALAALRVDPAFPLEPLVNTRDPAKETVCLRIAGLFPARLNPLGIQRALTSPVAEVRAAAIEAGLVTGERNALGACEATVREGGPAFATAALGLALSGEAKAVARLVAALGNATLAPPAIFALGFSGRTAAADALVEAMGDEQLAPLAAESFSAISGVTITNAMVGDADPADSESEVGLPTPDPETVAAWWTDHRPRFDPAQRWLRGQRWSVDGLLRELEDGPARRREALALDLAIRSQGEHRVTWNALSMRQRSELQRARTGIARISQKA